MRLRGMINSSSSRIRSQHHTHGNSHIPETPTTNPIRSGLVFTNRPPTPLRPPIISPSLPISHSYSRAIPTLPLPEQWNETHDRLICSLDVRDTPLQIMVSLLKRSFPELALVALTPGMVDKRLRVLDQDVGCPYWAEALAEHVAEVAVGGKGQGRGDT
jgi:hypothetical protein